jgi:hypothetical protein
MQKALKATFEYSSSIEQKRWAKDRLDSIGAPLKAGRSQ